MLAHVIHQMLLTRKRFSAVIAPVRRFASVPHYVIFEVIFARKILPADVAVERRVRDVRATFRAQMQHQIRKRLR